MSRETGRTRTGTICGAICGAAPARLLRAALVRPRLQARDKGALCEATPEVLVVWQPIRGDRCRDGSANDLAEVRVGALTGGAAVYTLACRGGILQ